MSQFAVYPMPGRRLGYVVDVQSHLLDGLATRVVVPLLPLTDAPKSPVRTLNPIFAMGGIPCMLMAQNIATVPLKQLGAPVGSLAAERDDVVRAIDALLSGL